jgi:hypothetical protein
VDGGGVTVEEVGLAGYFAAFHECVAQLTDVDLENLLVVMNWWEVSS